MRQFTSKHRQRIADALKQGAFFNCIECGKEFWRKPYEIKRGNNKFCSKLCYFLWQKGEKKLVSNPFDKSGENNPNWRGGIQPIHLKIRASKEFKEWRQKVFDRDDYTCQECGKRSKKGMYVLLHAHHKKPFAKFPKLRFEVDNGETLCKPCHDKMPKGKEVWTIT